MPQEILFAPPAESAEAAELREFIRHACTHNPLVRVLAKPSFVCTQARLIDVSTSGLALTYQRRIKPGTELVIQLEDEKLVLSRNLLASVVHAIPLGRGKWRMGCKFNGWLTDGELAAMLV
jgi:hypothetical protein